MMENARRSTNILIRVTPDLKERAERLAKAERRSLSSWVEGLIMEKIAADEMERPPAPRKPRAKRSAT
jgi:predicted HicB family RNase H-like nuclease